MNLLSQILMSDKPYTLFYFGYQYSSIQFKNILNYEYEYIYTEVEFGNGYDNNRCYLSGKLYIDDKYIFILEKENGIKNKKQLNYILITRLSINIENRKIINGCDENDNRTMI